MCAHAQSQFWWLKPTCNTHVIHFDYRLEQHYVAWMKKEMRNLEMRNLKQIELERLKNR